MVPQWWTALMDASCVTSQLFRITITTTTTIIIIIIITITSLATVLINQSSVVPCIKDNKMKYEI